MDRTRKLQNIKVKGNHNLLDDLHSKFIGLFNKFLHIGATELQSLEESESIRFTNKVNFLLIFTNVFFLTFFLVLDWISLGISLILVFFSCFLYYILLFFRFFPQAKLFYYFNLNLFVFIMSSAFGVHSGLFYFYIPLLVQIVLMFPENETQFRKLSLLMTILFIVLLEITDHSLLKIADIPENYLRYFNLYSMIGVSLLSFISITFVTSRKDSNNRFEEENEKLEKVLEKELSDKQKAIESYYFSMKMQQEVLNSMEGSIIILDEKGYVYTYNTNFRATFREPINQSTPTSFPEEIPTLYSDCEGINEITSSITDVLRNSVPYRELEFRRLRNYKIEYFSLKISRLKNSWFSGIFLLHNNITDLKQAKNRIEYFKRIEKSLLRVTPDILLNVDINGLIKDFSAEKSSSLYFPKDKMIGMSLFGLGIPESVEGEIKRIFQSCSVSETIQTIRYDFSFDGFEYSYEARFLSLHPEEIFIVFKKLEEREILSA